MDTESIINAISSIKLHNDDQVIAWTVDDFADFVSDQIQSQFNGDVEEARLFEPDYFEALDKAKAKQRQGQPVVIISLFRGEDASETHLLLNDLDRATLQDYTSPNNHAERLELLELKKKYKKFC